MYINYFKKPKFKSNKYNAKSSTYKGITYHSKLEAEYAMILDDMLKKKEIKGWKRQIKIPLDVNGFHICNYYIDFVVEENDGTLNYTEVKGYQTEIWRLKWKLTEAILNDKIKLGEIKLTIIR